MMAKRLPLAKPRFGPGSCHLRLKSYFLAAAGRLINPVLAVPGAGRLKNKRPSVRKAFCKKVRRSGNAYSFMSLACTTWLPICACSRYNPLALVLLT